MHKLVVEVAYRYAGADTSHDQAVACCIQCAHLSVGEHRGVLSAGHSVVLNVAE